MVAVGNKITTVTAILCVGLAKWLYSMNCSFEQAITVHTDQYTRPGPTGIHTFGPNPRTIASSRGISLGSSALLLLPWAGAKIGSTIIVTSPCGVAFPPGLKITVQWELRRETRFCDLGESRLPRWSPKPVLPWLSWTAIDTTTSDTQCDWCSSATA